MISAEVRGRSGTAALAPMTVADFLFGGVPPHARIGKVFGGDQDRKWEDLHRGREMQFNFNGDQRKW